MPSGKGDHNRVISRAGRSCSSSVLDVSGRSEHDVERSSRKPVTSRRYSASSRRVGFPDGAAQCWCGSPYPAVDDVKRRRRRESGHAAILVSPPCAPRRHGGAAWRSTAASSSPARNVALPQYLRAAGHAMEQARRPLLPSPWISLAERRLATLTLGRCPREMLFSSATARNNGCGAAPSSSPKTDWRQGCPTRR